MRYDFNQIAELYDVSRCAEEKIIDFIVEEGELKRDSRVLEIGCGTGNYTSLMKGRVEEVWGIDVSEGMLQQARGKCQGGRFIIDDAEQLKKMEDGYFKCVYMVDVIHHIKDMEAMFRNIKRVLEPGGCVFIFSDSHDHIKNRLTTKYFPETLEAELKRYPDIIDIIERMRESGINVMDRGVLGLGTDYDFGDTLLSIARNKTYSMFSLISEDALQIGIKNLMEDMKKEKIIYNKRAPYVAGKKI